MSRKVWNMIPYDKAAAAALAEKCGEDAFTVLLLMSRGIDTPEKITEFLSASLRELSSPFLLKDMRKAADRIRLAADSGEKIYIYGDYDADGVTSAALLFSYLETMGAKVSVRIPSRLTDGYGLSMNTAKSLADAGARLVVTVDNGISSFEEAEFFKSRGIDFIVTDHHKAREKLPNAFAVVNPQRADDSSPEKNLAGVGVALKLVSALEGGSYDTVFEEYGDLAAIGTIADIMPLTNENRVIAARGLQTLRNTCRPGLAALIKSCGFSGELNSSSVAFGIAPRINAAGRMGSAQTALKLLLTEDPAEAAVLVGNINEANTARQKEENRITDEAEAFFDLHPVFRQSRVLVAAGKGWHAGVIGIVASKLAEKYGKPAVVISIDADGTAKGSGRSLEGFSLYDALSFCSGTLTQFGGHTLAAGISLREENIDAFREKINGYAAEKPEFYPTLNIDCRLNPANISVDILSSLAALEPFGNMNPMPVFGLFDMKITSVKPVGSARHLKLTLTKGSVNIPAVYFGMTAPDFLYDVGDSVDAAVKIEKNEHMGKIKLSVQIRDIRPAGTDDGQLFGMLRLYSRFAHGGGLDEKEKEAICPDRGLVCEIYRYVRANAGKRFSPETLCMKIKRGASSAGAAAVSLAALTGLGLLKKDGDCYFSTAVSGKTNLADSPVLSALGYRDK